MPTFQDQIIAGTRIDAHGERNLKEMLEAFASKFAGSRQPINQNHDMSLVSPGHMENLRVVPDPLSPGDWNLIADLDYDSEKVSIPIGGFSISFLEIIRQSDSLELFQVFLPYPHYADLSLLDEIFSEGYISVGRWAKKSAETDTIALVSTVIVALLTPLWNNIYEEKIAPHVSQFFLRKFSVLKAKKINADFVQHIEYGGNSVEVHFIPSRGRESQCFGIAKTTAAMLMVHEYLFALEINHVAVRKIILQFKDSDDEFKFIRIEYTDGTLARAVS
jgi:hypothetical protein